MPEREQSFREMFYELSRLENKDVSIKMEGDPASPMQVVAAHMIKESGPSYMRDYIFDEEGNVKELCFNKIGLKKEPDTPMPDTD